jgi:hypothetical protein
MKKTFLQSYEMMFPPPVEYDLADYQITADMDTINTEKNGRWDLTPIPDLGIASQSAQADWMTKHGKNTTKLGKPMSDEEFQAHYGLPTARRTGRED